MACLAFIRVIDRSLAAQHMPRAWFGALWLDKAPGTQSFVTGTTKIIYADVAAAGAVELQKEGAVRAVRQHASAFTKRAVLFRQTAFVAFARENRHFFNLAKLCIY